MKLNELRPNEGSRRNRKRVGHDTSSGYGKTAGCGQKSQLARTGGKTRLGFEGGQVPLSRRMSKRGFENVNHKKYAIINLNGLNRFDNDNEATIGTLKSSGLVKKELAGVKLLANGELKVELTAKANKASEAVKKAIGTTGGTVGTI